MNARWSKNISIRSDKDVDIETLFTCFSEKGLKFSRQRAVVIEYFVNSDRHFTVEQLYLELRNHYPHLGYSTVYRTLKLLVECGAAHVHHFGEEDARFEPVHVRKHHDHLVCRKCGRIIEFTHEGIEKLQKQVARKHGFIVDDHELQLFGVCKECRASRKRKDKYGGSDRCNKNASK